MDNIEEKIKVEVEDLISYLEKAYYQIDEMRDEYMKYEYSHDLIMSSVGLGDCINKLQKLLERLGQ